MIQSSVLENILKVGGHLWLENGQLYYRIPKAHSQVLTELIKLNKSTLVSELLDKETEEERRAKKVLHIEHISEDDSFLPLRVERIWRAEFEKNGAAPVIPFDLSFSVLLEPDVDVDCFVESVYYAVTRHDALRMRLKIENNRPTLLAADDVKNADIKVISIAGSVRSNPVAVKEAANQVLYPSIRLLSESGFRCRIIRDDDGNTIFGAVLHHYICDYWSTRILMNEIRKHYRNVLTKSAPEIDPGAFQYVEYTLAQRRTVLEFLPAYLAHWNNSLRRIEPACLPYDHVQKTDQMEPLIYLIKADLVIGIRRIALSLGTSLFVILLAGYQILLSRWTKCRDVVNAISVADRFNPLYTSVFGYLITALPIASRIKGDELLSDFITHLSMRLEAGYSYKELSYELYEDIFFPKSPFCTTLFNYIPVDRLPLGMSATEPVENQNQLLFLSGPPFVRQMHHREIYFELVELLVGLRGRIYFNRDFFSKSTMENLVQQYISILEAISAGGFVRCKELLG